MVDLPLPVCHTKAICFPFSIVKSIFESISRGLDGYENERFLNEIFDSILLRIFFHSSTSASISNTSIAFS